jgi:hypothetical protein
MESTYLDGERLPSLGGVRDAERPRPRLGETLLARGARPPRPRGSGERDPDAPDLGEAERERERDPDGVLERPRPPRGGDLRRIGERERDLDLERDVLFVGARGRSNRGKREVSIRVSFTVSGHSATRVTPRI